MGTFQVSPQKGVILDLDVSALCDQNDISESNNGQDASLK